MTAKILAFDIELTPLKTYTWSLWPDSIPTTMIIEPQHMLCFGARWYGSKKVIFKSTYHDGKEAMLQELWNLLDESDAAMSWNGARFDSRHVRREFLEAGMLPPSPWKDIDLMQETKRVFYMPSNKLDYVSQDLDIGKKTPHEGFGLWIKCMDGDDAAWRKMKQYQLQDVNLLVDMYDKLKPWIRLPLPFDSDGCLNCGGLNLQKRGFAGTGASRYQRLVCLDCGKWQRPYQRIGSASPYRNI
jgi:hypothetical protein